MHCYLLQERKVSQRQKQLLVITAKVGGVIEMIKVMELIRLIKVIKVIEVGKVMEISRVA
jgi:hypothetical protein